MPEATHPHLELIGQFFDAYSSHDKDGVFA